MRPDESRDLPVASGAGGEPARRARWLSLILPWLAARAGIDSVPSGVTWRHIFGVAWLAGIGFTMSLFIADLGLGQGSPLAMAGVGILAASVVAGAGGYLVLRSAARPGNGPGASADETA